MPEDFPDAHIHKTIIDEHVFQVSDKRSQSTNNPKTRFHIFFITGNPGCIGYYHEFLSLLWDNLGTTRNAVDMSIYGTSMKGFSSNDQGPILSLQEQIAFLEERLEKHVTQHAKEDTTVKHKVVIVGHSVGAYIGLELIRRRQSNGACMRLFDVVGYVGLWPTLTHIGQSKRGRRVGWLLKLPFFAFFIGFVAMVLSRILSQALLVFILKIAGFPDKSAKVTAAFLGSRRGVHQALYMAADEMREINSDRWSEDIWGAVSQPPSKPTPKLFLWFGEDDHWVANHHRDDLIATRGRHPNRHWLPEMVIDDTGIPHSFCIHHSKPVAERTAIWVNNIITSKP